MLNAEELTGTVLSDRYVILQKIGTGGMAMVYKAHDKVLDRDIAIKVLRDNFEGNKEIVSNFIKEARSSASLVHPNVVSVYDVCEYDGINYMVMELVDGITLKKYIKEHVRLPWQEACDYAIQIGQGIQAAHERGIIHRDIKPQNIIMAPGGVLKVTDFGIAKAMESDTSVAGGTATGSVHYISPEQAKGGYTDFRSDIYSLGICLYEMLAGRVPFDGDTPVSVALMHIEEEAVNVKCVNMDVPQNLAYVTMKAMNRDPQKRYLDMQSFIDDLRAVLADENLPSKEGEEPEISDEYYDENYNNKYEDEFVDENYQEEPKNGISDSISDKGMTNRGRKTRTKTKKRKSKKKKKAERNSIILAIVTVAVIVLVVAGILIATIHPTAKSVPDVTNMTLEDATKTATDKGYTIDPELEYSISDDVAENLVISQEPAAGTEGNKDTPIKLVISLGASGGGIVVPDASHMDVDAAEAMLDGYELNYRVVQENSDNIELGYIIHQLPKAGTHINAGDYVTLYMSMGPQTETTQKSKVTVPNLIGLALDNAEKTLSQNGLGVGSVTKTASAKPAGTIIKQSPAATASVKEGTNINIVISSGQAAATEAPVQTEPAQNEESAVEENTTASAETNVGQSTNNAETATKEQTETNTAGNNEAAVSSQIFTVKIPDAANDKVRVEIMVNGTVVHDAEHSKSEETVAVEISGSGTANVQAYIDGSKVCDKTVTF